MFGIALEFDSAELTEQARRDLQTWPMRSTGLELVPRRLVATSRNNQDGQRSQ